MNNLKRSAMALSILIALLCATGCSQETQVTAEIINVQTNDDRGWMSSCISGPNVSTTVKTSDGRVDTLCAYLGEVGDSITGYWREGSLNANLNGFKTST